jgi:hypothetical protein
MVVVMVVMSWRRWRRRRTILRKRRGLRHNANTQQQGSGEHDDFFHVY